MSDQDDRDIGAGMIGSALVALAAILLVLFIGDPDIHDAIIQHLMRVK